ncbi:acyl-CoA dehydrogenase family protein [Amycolatopsis alkalitolerans]|uniref:Acyl-CoA dehydrogenase n=1 Tax=Amycolatopsis alkalitolerans TaxID=2547244 RepID=A0A5C4LSC7_9PSEU|nr:acyl-CoA dehydrogenase family protein [Amycolatopsis alkalitolerans]TNC19349.1 acyl-CoA dehydrogenase [Amycolatopsis alkalitolerans]
MSDLLYSETEEDLRASVRGLFADKADAAAVLVRTGSEEPYDLKLWRTLAVELGLAGLLVPEKLGGQGASAREVAVVLEELGRAVVPVPFLGSAVLATSALLACEPGEPLRRLATGEATGALAVPLSTWPGAGFPTTVKAAGSILNGRISVVADAAVADVLIVPALSPDGPGLYAVEGATVTEATSLDLTRRLADVTLEGVTGQLLAGPDRAAAALEQALLTGAGLLASEQLGVAQWCLDETVAYVKQRYQFGRPVGSFQALKHRLADLYLEIAMARAAARNAADALATGSDDVGIAVAVAQSSCAAVAVHAAEEAVQLHGGIGMTWEHPVHLYLKRAKSDELALGTPGRHRAALATLANLPA